MFPNLLMNSLQTSALIPLPIASLTLCLRSLIFYWEGELLLVGACCANTEL